MARLDGLRDRVRSLGQAVVALSGGVDSSLLAAVAQQELGARAVAATVHYESFPPREREQAAMTAREAGVRHVAIPQTQLADVHQAANGPDRCARCRSKVAAALRAWFPDVPPQAILVGVHVDDLGPDRPGVRSTQAAGLGHPYLDLGWGKADIRAAARALGLSTAERPSNACLASRIAHGMPLTQSLLDRIDGLEGRLLGLGVGRVRYRVGPSGTRVEADPHALALLRAHEADIAQWSVQAGFPPPTFTVYRAGGAA